MEKQLREALKGRFQPPRGELYLIYTYIDLLKQLLWILGSFYLKVINELSLLPERSLALAGNKKLQEGSEAVADSEFGRRAEGGPGTCGWHGVEFLFSLEN